MLVGTKEDIAMDVRDTFYLHENHPPITKISRALALSRRIGAYAYLECSAKLNKGVKNVFVVACQALFPGPKKKSLFCF